MDNVLSVDNLVSAAAKNRPVDLAIPSAKLLVRDVEFPAMSSSSLAQAIRLDVQRSVPFSPTNLRVSYQTTGRSGGKVHVRQFLCRDGEIEEFCAQARAHGVTVKSVIPAEAPDHPLVDFTANLTGRYRLWHKLNGVLMLVILFTGWYMFMLPYWDILAQRDTAQETVASLRDEISQITAQIDAQADDANGLELVQRLQERNAVFLKQIETVTTTLPDSTWLTSITIENDMMRLSGSTAQRPIELAALFPATSTASGAVLVESTSLGGTDGESRFILEVPVSEAKP